MRVLLQGFHLGGGIINAGKTAAPVSLALELSFEFQLFLGGDESKFKVIAFLLGGRLVLFLRMKTEEKEMHPSQKALTCLLNIVPPEFLFLQEPPPKIRPHMYWIRC